MNKKKKIWIIVGVVSTIVVSLSLSLGLGLGLTSLSYRGNGYIDEILNSKERFKISKQKHIDLINKYNVICLSAHGVKGTREYAEGSLEKLVPAGTITGDYEDIVFTINDRSRDVETKLRCWDVEK